MPNDGVETQIRETAYTLWEADGRPWGQDHGYWEQAFAMVMARLEAEPDEVSVPLEGSASAAVRRRIAARADFNLKVPAAAEPKRSRPVSAKAKIAKLNKASGGGTPKRAPARRD